MNKKQKFNKAAYMKEYHKRKAIEKTNGSVKLQDNGKLLDVINAYRVLCNSTQNGEIRANLNKSFANIITDMA